MLYINITYIHTDHHQQPAPVAASDSASSAAPRPTAAPGTSPALRITGFSDGFLVPFKRFKGVPRKWMVHKGKSQTEMDDLGVPLL